MYFLLENNIALLLTVCSKQTNKDKENPNNSNKKESTHTQKEEAKYKYTHILSHYTHTTYKHTYIKNKKRITTTNKQNENKGAIHVLTSQRPPPHPPPQIRHIHTLMHSHTQVQIAACTEGPPNILLFHPSSQSPVQSPPQA